MGPAASPGCVVRGCFESSNAWAVTAEAEVAAMFVMSDGNPVPASVAGTGLAVGSRPRIVPGEQTAGRLHPESVAAKTGAGANLPAGANATSPRDYLERTARRIARAGCVPRSGSIASIEPCVDRDVPRPRSRRAAYEGRVVLACTRRRLAGPSYPRERSAGGSCLDGTGGSGGTGAVAPGSWDVVAGGMGSRRRR